MSAWWWLAAAWLLLITALVTLYHAARQYDRKAGR